MTTIFSCEKNNVLIRFVKIYGIWTNELNKLTSEDIEVIETKTNNEIFSYFIDDPRKLSKIFFYNLGMFLKHRELDKYISNDRKGKEDAIRKASIELEDKMGNIQLSKEQLRMKRLEAFKKNKN